MNNPNAILFAAPFSDRGAHGSLDQVYSASPNYRDLRVGESTAIFAGQLDPTCMAPLEANVPCAMPRLLTPSWLGSDALPGRTAVSGPAITIAYLCVGRRGGWSTYSAVSAGSAGVLFIRSGSASHTDGQSLAALVTAAAANHRRHHFALENVNSQNPVLLKERADREIEYKLTLIEPPDLFATAVHLHDRLADGRLRGFVPYWFGSFMTWSYSYRPFEILGPKSQRGYLAYIREWDGRYILRWKTFVKDAIVRREVVHKGLRIVEPLEEHARQLIGAGAVLRAYPEVARLRVDVDCESLASGRHYGIKLDRTSSVDGRSKALYQCEIEYQDTRWMMSTRPLTPELRRVRNWVEMTCGSLGVSTARTKYSKLSYLRDSFLDR